MRWISRLGLQLQAFLVTLILVLLLSAFLFHTKNFAYILFIFFILFIYFAFIFKGKFQNLYVALAPVFLVLAIFELFYIPDIKQEKIVQVGWKMQDYLQLHFLSKDGVWYLKSNQNMRHVHDQGEYDYRISTVSCGGVAVRDRCPANAESWHFGDSFTFGFGVDGKDIFVRKFSDLSSSINFGVPGFNPLEEIDQSIALLENNRLQYPKKIYFHFFLGNDVAESVGKIGKLKKNIEPKEDIFFIHEVLLKPKLFDVSKKSLLGFNIWRKGLSKNTILVPGHIKSISEEFWVENKQFFLEALETRFSRLRAIYDGQVVISFIPPKEICLVGKSGWNSMTSDISRLATKYKISTVDFFSAYKCPKLVDAFFPIDTHFNQNGHEMMYLILRSK
jgi:hypothetical protein